MARMILIPTSVEYIDADQVRRIRSVDSTINDRGEVHIFFNDDKHVVVPCGKRGGKDAENLRDEIAGLVDGRGPSFLKLEDGNYIDPRLVRFVKAAEATGNFNPPIRDRIIIGYGYGGSGSGTFVSGESLNHVIINCDSFQEAEEKCEAFIKEVEWAVRGHSNGGKL